MNQFKKIAVLFFVTTIISAMTSGFTTGPEAKSSSGKNHESENKKIKEPGYY
jgi:hypothetical protein